MQIEKRMHDDLNQIGDHYIDIGRCLNAVKEEGLVPHGEWVSWVREHAQMSERSAQRVMRAAREIDEKSPLARLEFSKVQALLAVPADEREDFAQEVKADTLSVRELKAAVKARELANMRAEAAEKQTEILREKIARMNQDMESEKATAARSQKEADRKAMDAMKTELRDMEDELRRRAKAEAEAKEELLRLKTQAARGTAAVSERLTPEDLAAAARAFMGQVAVLPHMGRELAGCPQRTREAYLAQVNTVSDWCERAKRALNTYEGEVLVSE